MSSYTVGLLGEMQAARYLRRQGMLILARRFRAAHGEIDLIAREGETLVFVEVKTRKNGRIGDGVQAVNAEKKKRIRFAAKAYLSAHPAALVRFDVIEITASGIRHIKNAM